MSEPTWKEIPWDEVKQQPPDDWLDCSIGSVLCSNCQTYVGMLMIDDDPKTCEGCGRIYRLDVRIVFKEPTTHDNNQ